MGLLLKQLFGFIRLLHSENGIHQIVWGLTLGAFLGFSPILSLQSLLVFLILILFKVQFGAAFVSAFFFKFVAFLIDPLADTLGRAILENESFRSTWTYLYNLPLLPYTRFNNSIVMGSFLVALILSPILYFTFYTFVKKYRSTIVEKVKQTKFWRAIQATKFYNWYLKYDDLYGQ